MAMRVTKTAWFGPKRSPGWGWTPVSPEGWVVVGIFVVLLVVSILLWPGAGAAIASALLVALLLLVILFTGDSPGGRDLR
jgi:hypothetical protein